ncbi:MAG TPA: AAA family ATPase, partial [Acidimicrobiales bacterium]|nr:AAA family ATPase [Acidimicrobiales bacterium]
MRGTTQSGMEPQKAGTVAMGRRSGSLTVNGSGDEPTGSHVEALGQTGVIGVRTADVGASREHVRQGRFRRLLTVLVPIAALLAVRDLVWHRGPFALPHFPHALVPYIPAMALILLFGCALIIPLLGAGRSPHVLYRPNEIDVSLSDVRGAKTVVEEVVKTLNLFLGHKMFADAMGGTARRAILFEGPPGTGKTYMAKAMAAEAGVPFLFVSSSAFQSMFYGQTNRKIRAYFRALRKYARREGGAIGFIEEIDAIGGARGGMGGAGRHHDGVAGVVNELLIQLQSFDQPPAKDRL